MILGHAKELSEKQAGVPVKQAVLTVPSNWDMVQRKMLEDAAGLADLKVLA